MPNMTARVSVLLFAFYASWGDTAFSQPLVTQDFITISEETTHLTKPLTQDGYLDYSAAINKINAVPRNENAAAFLIEMIGVPKYWEAGQREKLRKILGLDELPVAGTGNYRGMYHFALQLEDTGLPVPTQQVRFDQSFMAVSRPWTPDEAPFVQDWIENNSKCLSRVDEILALPNYFEPMLRGRARNLTIVPESCGIAKNARKELRELLLSRCFLQLGEERFEQAVDDLLRIHRLARLGRKSQLNLGLADHIPSSESSAINAGQTMVESVNLDRASWIRYLTGLGKLEPCVNASRWCRHHRLSHLATAAICAKESPRTFVGNTRMAVRFFNSALSQAGVESEVELEVVPYCCKLPSREFDWDYLLRRINARYDRAEQIHKLPSSVHRLQAMREFADFRKRERMHFADGEQFKAAQSEDSRRAKQDLTDDLHVVLDEMVNMELFSTYEELALRARLHLLQLAVAARIFEKDNGRLPQSQQDIKRYLGEELIDPFSEKPYRWKVSAEEIQLSSASNDDAQLPRAYREIAVSVKSRAK